MLSQFVIRVVLRDGLRGLVLHLRDCVLHRFLRALGHVGADLQNRLRLFSHGHHDGTGLERRIVGEANDCRQSRDQYRLRVCDFVFCRSQALVRDLRRRDSGVQADDRIVGLIVDGLGLGGEIVMRL